MPAGAGILQPLTISVIRNAWQERPPISSTAPLLDVRSMLKSAGCLGSHRLGIHPLAAAYARFPKRNRSPLGGAVKHAVSRVS
jgi:hypothetical protein